MNTCSDAVHTASEPCLTAREARLTPSKRSAQTQGADLEALLSKCKAVLLDPTLASPSRRTLHAFAHRALTEVAEKASSIQQDEFKAVTHFGCFESKQGFTYHPQNSPPRHKSAAEVRSTACLAAQLGVGNEKMQMTSLQKSLIDRRPPRSMNERSLRIQDKLAGKE
jgi:hypothetical protein